jgi:enoyl-CoA hydratase
MLFYQMGRTALRPTIRSVYPEVRLLSTLAAGAPTTLKDSYEYIQVEQKESGVGLIRLHRPKAMNALSDALFQDLIHAATALDQDDSVGCLVLTGSTKAFAAGADIAEMKDRTFDYTYKKNMFAEWADFTRVSKPVIAAVNGYALGGGCELAMMCDFILAGSKAKFGQPEINLGVIPGAGGTQRLVRAIGKSKAMQMVLTGDMIDAEAAERAGLVAGVYPAEELVDEAIKMAAKIACKGRMSVLMAKEAVNASQELSLQEGLRLERRLFGKARSKLHEQVNVYRF